MMTMDLEHNRIDLQASIKPPETGSPSTVSIDGRIQTASSAQSFGIQYATANIEASDIDLRPILEFIDPGMGFTATNTVASLHSALSIFPDQAGYSLVANTLTGRIEKLEVHGKLSVTGLTSQQPAFFFSGSVPTYKIEKLTQLIPQTWRPSALQSILVQQTIAGDFEVEQLTIAGPLDFEKPHSILGHFRIAHGLFAPHTDISPLRNIQASMVLNHDHLTINKFSADYESSRITEIKGRIDFRTSDPWLALIATGDVSATDVLNTAHQLDSLKHDPPAWLDLQHVEGDAAVSLTIEGPLTEPEKLKVHQGKLMVRSLGFQLIASPFLVKAISGSIMFDQTHLSFNRFSATYQSSNIRQAHGRIEFRETGPWLALTTNGDLLAVDALNIARRLDTFKPDRPTWLDLHRVEGHALIDLKIEGPLTEPGKLKIHQGELTVQNLGFQSSAFPLAIQRLSGNVGFDQDHAAIHTLRGRIGESQTTFSGNVSFGQHDRLNDITIQSQVELSDLQLLLPKLSQENSLSGGPVTMAMTVSGATEQPVIEARAKLTPVHISYPSFLQKPAGIPMELTFDGTLMPNQNLNIHQATIGISPFHLDMEGEVSFGDTGRMDINLTTGSDNGSFLPANVVVGPEQLGLRHLMATVHIQGSGKDWMAWKTNGIIGLNKPDGIAAETHSDTLKTGRIQWNQENNLITLDFRTHDLPLETVIPREGIDAPKISGNLTANLSIETALTHAQPLTRSMIGNGEFQIRDGHVIQSPVISRILGILNLPNLLMGKINLAKEGVPFNSLTGTFTINNGQATSNDLLLNSPVIKMTAAGKYDVPEDQLDFIVAVSPFGEYSNLLKKIPLFGRLLKGERKGLTTALFEVKGSRTDPQVTYQPLQSFTEGLQGVAQFAVDVLKNTITLPKDLLTEPQKEHGAPQ